MPDICNGVGPAKTRIFIPLINTADDGLCELPERIETDVVNHPGSYKAEPAFDQAARDLQNAEQIDSAVAEIVMTHTDWQSHHKLCHMKKIAFRSSYCNLWPHTENSIMKPSQQRMMMTRQSDAIIYAHYKFLSRSLYYSEMRVVILQPSEGGYES